MITMDRVIIIYLISFTFDHPVTLANPSLTPANLIQPYLTFTYNSYPELTGVTLADLS